jgi:hypothetical protein
MWPNVANKGQNRANHRFGVFLPALTHTVKHPPTTQLKPATLALPDHDPSWPDSAILTDCGRPIDEDIILLLSQPIT